MQCNSTRFTNGCILNFLGFIKNYPACRPAACKKFKQSQLGYLRLKNCNWTSKCQSIGELGIYFEFFLKSLTMPKKTERVWIFQHLFCRKTPKKIEGGNLLRKHFFRKKISHNAEKKLSKVGPFILTRKNSMLRGKKEKPFWFCSLGQTVQFDTIKIRKTCRTILEKNTDKKPWL